MIVPELADFIERHPRLVVLTGAGCSTGSGIPAYRDDEGAWAHRRPMTFAEFSGSPGARRRYWAGSLRGWPRVRDARPGAAHTALAALEDAERARIVTQNVDGLHQKAGARRVIDLHGRLDVVECLACGARLDREDVQALLLSWNGPAAAGPARPDGDTQVEGPLDDFHVPDCRECGGILKPSVVFFGENVPRSRVDQAMDALARADALLVVGSSLMVYSGYRFVAAARSRGRPVAALNLGRTRADGELQLKVVGDCGALLEAAVGAVLRCPRAETLPAPAASSR
jgi:NAD-dependent SIR2 family protein deacetylase